MKTTTLFYSLILVMGSFMMSCDNSTITTGDGSQETEGNGKVKTESRDLLSFDQVHITGVFNVILEQGSKEAVSVEADENVLPLIITEVVDNILQVKIKDDVSIKHAKKINVHITLVDLQVISMQGVGTLKSEGMLQLKEIELKNEGVGTTNLSLNADKLTVNTASVGALTLSGSVKDVSIKHDGVGILKAFELKTSRLSLITSGVGASEVYATEEISIDAAGIGSVKYKGGAAKKNIKSEGVGTVSEL
jgi:hypothetical protein